MSRWIVRVYALCPGPCNTWLTVEEYFQGGWIHKFPGGGVEASEGLLEALQRELWEELRVEIQEAKHFYTTHFYQRSYYHTDARLLAVYYQVQVSGTLTPMNPRLRLKWLPPDFMQLTFPIDRFVSGLLLRGESSVDGEPLRTYFANAGRPGYPLAPLPE
ncbi:MAG: NUDIX domain-containing protein [Bacteroidia bacterium]|nr:NUDIX domain-containing protein [Bacteroidia bacterium]